MRYLNKSFIKIKNGYKGHITAKDTDGSYLYSLTIPLTRLTKEKAIQDAKFEIQTMLKIEFGNYSYASMI